MRDGDGGQVWGAASGLPANPEFHQIEFVGQGGGQPGEPGLLWSLSGKEEAAFPIWGRAVCAA